VINGTIYYEPILTTYMRVLFFLILPNLICFVVTRFMESKPPIVSLVHCLCVNIYFSLIITLNLRKFYFDLLAIKFLFTYTVDGTDGVLLTIHLYSMTTMFIFIVIAFSMIGFVIINFFIYHLSNYYYEQNINNCCMDPICNLMHHPCCDPPNDVYGVFNEINKNYISINSLMNEISRIQQHYPVIKVKQTPKKNRNNINESDQDISVFIQYGSWEETEDCPMIPNKSIIHYKCEIDCELDDVIQERIFSSINTQKKKRKRLLIIHMLLILAFLHLGENYLHQGGYVFILGLEYSYTWFYWHSGIHIFLTHSGDSISDMLTIDTKRKCLINNHSRVHSSKWHGMRIMEKKLKFNGL